MFAVRCFGQAFRPPRLDPSRGGVHTRFLRSSHRHFSFLLHSRMAENDGIPAPIVLVIAGPTAAGKSDVAARLCADEKGMIISADSVQAYRGVQIGANKPSVKEQEETPHILINVADHTENYNAAAWREDALFSIQMLLNPGKGSGAADVDASNGWPTVETTDPNAVSTRNEPRRIAIEQSIQRGRISKGYGEDQSLLPVVCGGTMMYLQWLVHGQPDAMRPTPSAVEESYETIRKFQDDDDKCYQDAVDYVSSFGTVFADRTMKFSGEDWYRLRRTLEVALTVQKTTSTPQTTSKPHRTGHDGANQRSDEDPLPNEVGKLAEQLYTGQRQGSLASLGYDVRCFFLCPDDRMGHTSVVDERCEQMIIKGLIRETAELSMSGRLPEMAERAIGYRQTLDYLRHRLTEKDEGGKVESEDDAFDFYLKSFTTATRQYAKTQMSWFRKDKDFMFVPIPLGMEKVDRVDSAVTAIKRLCGLPRHEYEHELLGDDSVSSKCKKKNAEQGKKMKFYQFERHILKPGSKELKTALEEAVELREWFHRKKRKIEEVDAGTGASY
jgi:tRNA dimethylallyltransferase